MDNPIKILDERAHELTDTDIECFIPELMEHFSGKIHSLSTYVYGSEKGVALAAFKEYSLQTLQKGVETFVFKNQHWRSGRSIGPYLATCLSKLADNLKSDINYVKKVSIPVCPACKTFNDREFLVYEGKLLRCPTCTKEHSRLEDKQTRTSREEFQYRIRKIYSLHSRKGRRCPMCERFIPESFIVASVKNNGRISCPFDTCFWFGIESELEPMVHPLGQNSGVTVSLNVPINNCGGHSRSRWESAEFQDVIDAKEINPDIRMEQEEKWKKELEITNTVLSTQKLRLSKQPMKKVIKKYLMYEAFQILLDYDPAGMIGYLIHGKSIGERPIQSVIFQKYVRLIENRLPFIISGEDGDCEVYSLLDPNLNLFLGMSEFYSHVKDSGFVSNNTHEIFVGAKCNGPCFIGMLCSITDEAGNSLLSEVEYYTFSGIKMKNTVPKNTLVKVVHFRMPPHYEMYSMVLLQRIRRKIVDSIYKRLHGSARPLKGYK